MFTRVPSTTKTVFVGGPVPADMEIICAVLNSDQKPEVRDELRMLVERWRRSGPNLAKMLLADEALELELENSWRGKYWATRSPRAHIGLIPIKWLRPTPRESAVAVFAALTLNPDCERLSGPCSYPPCGRFFVQKTKRRTLYCSRRCCQFASAIRHRRQQLEREREDKLERAKGAIKRWRSLRNKDDWKTSVSKQEPDITVKFLTRAVTKGDLEPPRPSETGKETHR